MKIKKKVLRGKQLPLPGFQPDPAPIRFSGANCYFIDYLLELSREDRKTAIAAVEISLYFLNGLVPPWYQKFVTNEDRARRVALALERGACGPTIWN